MLRLMLGCLLVGGKCLDTLEHLCLGHTHLEARFS